MCSRDTVSEVCIILPLLLGAKTMSKIPEMCMDVNQPGNDGLSAYVNNLCIGRNRNLIRSSDCFNFVPIYNDDTILNHFVSLHGHDAGTLKRNFARRNIRFCHQVDLKADGIKGRN